MCDLHHKLRKAWRKKGWSRTTPMMSISSARHQRKRISLGAPWKKATSSASLTSRILRFRSSITNSLGKIEKKKFKNWRLKFKTWRISCIPSQRFLRLRKSATQPRLSGAISTKPRRAISTRLTATRTRPIDNSLSLTKSSVTPKSICIKRAWSKISCRVCFRLSLFRILSREKNEEAAVPSKNRKISSLF